jgi:hypothetical protein
VNGGDDDLGAGAYGLEQAGHAHLEAVEAMKLLFK